MRWHDRKPPCEPPTRATRLASSCSSCSTCSTQNCKHQGQLLKWGRDCAHVSNPGHPEDDRARASYLHIPHILCAHIAWQGVHAVLAEAQ